MPRPGPNPGPAGKTPPVKVGGRSGGIYQTTPKPAVVKKKPVNPLTRMNITQQQRWLADRGFNVTVDGIEGPQTRMARKAFINGVSPSYWNKVWKRNHSGGNPTGAGNAATPLPNAVGPVGAAPGGGGGGGAGGKGGTVTRTPTGANPAQAASAGFEGQIDPEAFATSMVNSEYDPQIADAQYNLKYAQKSGQEALADLLGWNKQINNTFNRYDATDAYNEGIGYAEGAAGNVANLFGESTGAESQAENADNIGLMSALKASQGGFQDIMQSVFAAQGRDYARRATRESKNDVTKAQMGLTELRQAKGQAKGKALYEAQNLALNQATAKQALDQAAALAGPEQQIAMANAQTAQIEAKNAPAIAKLKLKQAQAETAAAMKAANADSGKINWSDPTVVDSVSNGAISGAIGPKGGLVLRPDLALQNILVTAQGAGAPASVVSAAIAKLVRALNISHGKKQWARWKWNGKSFVLGKPPKK